MTGDLPVEHCLQNWDISWRLASTSSEVASKFQLSHDQNIILLPRSRTNPTCNPTIAEQYDAKVPDNWLRVSIGIRVAFLKENDGLHGWGAAMRAKG